MMFTLQEKQLSVPWQSPKTSVSNQDNRSASLKVFLAVFVTPLSETLSPITSAEASVTSLDIF